MHAKVEFAPAKINLTLEVLGRRTDGYHELRSLVAFASDVGDRVALDSDAGSGTRVVGPFASAIGEGNLVDAAVAAVSRQLPDFGAVGLTLEKNLPVASGIGGGSADAAAALRLLRSANPQVATLDLPAIACSLGADVPVCLRGHSAIMTGIGEKISEIEFPGELFAVLANPRIDVPAKKTAEVFRLLAAPPLADSQAKESPPVFASVGDIIRYTALRGNTLEKPARQLFPEINEVITALAKLPRSRVAQLSGAGPTCFALFETDHGATTAARILKSRHPGWWIAKSRLS
jgi:4-diphosphocytidyl-2-C-methyl-D-erythritol kinase